MVLCLALLFLVAACTGAPQDGWPGVTVSGNRTYALIPGFKLLALNREARSGAEAFPARGEWQFPREKDQKLSGTYSTPVLVDGTIYITTYALGGLFGRLYAINAENGELRWEFSPGGTSSSIVSSPTVLDGTVYLGSADHKAYAIDAASGQKKWEFETKNKVWAGVRVDGSGAYVASLDHHVYALDRATGKLRWQFKTGGPIASTPAYDKETLYFGSGDGTFYALDTSTGSPRWVFHSGGWLWGTPLVRNGVIYAGSLGKRVFALDASTGRPKWVQPFETFGAVSATPVMVPESELLAVADQSGRVYGLNPETGSRRWGRDYTTDPQAPIHAALATDGSRVYTMSLNRKVVALNGVDGRPDWTCPTGGDQICR